MMETEEADETEGQSSEQRGLQAQVVITLLPASFYQQMLDCILLILCIQ